MSALQVADLLCQQVATRNDLTQPVVKHASPAELERVFQKVCFPLDSRFQLHNTGCGCSTVGIGHAGLSREFCCLVTVK